MSCEGDLTSADLDQSTSSHTLARVSAGTSTSQNLYPYIVHQLCHGLNLEDTNALVKILRPHNERDSRDESIVNLDSDDGIIVNIQFSELVRIKQILISIPPSGDRPQRCRVWVNRPDGVDFGEVDDIKPEQDFELLDGETGAIEYPVKIARFNNVSTLTLHFSARTSSTTFRIWYLGFKGESRVYKRQAGEQMTIAAENAADSMVDGVRDKHSPSQTTIR